MRLATAGILVVLGLFPLATQADTAVPALSAGFGRTPVPESAASPAPVAATSAAPNPGPEALADPQSPTPHPKPRAETKTAPSPKPSAAGAHGLPEVLQEVEAKYAKAATLQADFTQTIEFAALKSRKVSSGVIMVKRPDKIRWETLKPDMNLLVSDGRHFWLYTPPFDEGEHGQVIERKSSEINSKLANALLSGRFSVARDMKIRQESPSRFLLVPKPGTAGTVVRAEIEINPGQKTIQKVILDHKGGNHSEIQLSRIELGKPIGDEAFVFTAPPGTDKVEK